MRKGAFVPFAISPSADGGRTQTFASYDSARARARLDASVQVPLVDRIQLQAVLDYDEGDTDPALAAQFDVLQERDAPIDLQVSAGWDGEGVNNTSAAFAQATVGRSVGSEIYAFGGARFDLGTDGDEAGLRVNAAAVRPIGYGMVAGIDSKVDVDLEQDAQEPENESTWAMQAGPVLGYTIDPVAVTASVGVATDKRRSDGDLHVGAYAGAGLGLAF